MEPSPEEAPILVSNMRLKSRGSVRSQPFFLRVFGWLLRALLVADLVGAEARLAGAAVDHGIREAADVSGGFEDVLVGEDAAVESDDVIAFANSFAPPIVFEVAFKFGTEWAIVPASVESAVDFC